MVAGVVFVLVLLDSGGLASDRRSLLFGVGTSCWCWLIVVRASCFGYVAFVLLRFLAVLRGLFGVAGVASLGWGVSVLWWFLILGVPC